MKTHYLYLIPLIWTLSGILYARSLPKDGFNGVAEVFLTLVIGVLLLVGVVVYHVIKNNKKD